MVEAIRGPRINRNTAAKLGCDASLLVSSHVSARTDWSYSSLKPSAATQMINSIVCTERVLRCGWSGGNSDKAKTRER